MADKEDRREPEVEIREIGIGDVAAVYHLGDELFTSEEFPILYRTWDAHDSERKGRSPPSKIHSPRLGLRAGFCTDGR